jgi:hypothetical protein
MRRALPSVRATLTLAALLAAAPTETRAQSLVVSGRANIFGAGLAAPPAPGGGGAGELPPSYAFAAAPRLVLAFSSVTGTASCCGAGGHVGPDGGSHASGTTDIRSAGGISGILKSDATMFLVGVFLAGGAQPAVAPPRLDFSGAAAMQSAFAPLLGQTFFIGDGLTGTGSGAVQRFLVPVGATHLYLGFADALEFGFPTSDPGYYGDNQGQLTAEFTVRPTSAPEPATHALLATALVALALARRRARPRPMTRVT